MNKEIIEELNSVGKDERNSIIEGFISDGICIPFPDSVFIGRNVQLEKGCVILGGTILCGNTKIGENCVIGPDSILFNTSVENGSSLNNTQSTDSTVGKDCTIGPFVQIRPGSNIGDKVHLGNFVEVKNSSIGDETSVSHLTYIGDSDVGKKVNFGCGTVTVNYNGKEKFRTTIGDHAFIGCNTNLVAPVTIGDYGYTAAGSTITDNVPENALAIARARQVNKEDWVLKKKPYKGMD